MSFRVCIRWGPRAERRNNHIPQPLNQKLFPIDNHLQMKQLVFCKGVTVEKHTSLKGGTMPRSRCPTDSWLHTFGGSLSLLLCQGFCLFFNLAGPLLPVLCLVWNSCVYDHVCARVCPCVSYTFSPTLFLLLVLSSSYWFGFVLSYVLLLLLRCCFLFQQR